MRFDSARLSDYTLRAALVIPFAYHGAWNLGAEGGVWWAAHSGLPPALRFAVGVGEICAALGIAARILHRVAAAIMAIIMLGAVQVHAPQGFSFKTVGCETPLVYALLCVSLALSPPATRRD